MPSRELVVLGTASQVPTRTRNHNAYFVRWDRWGLLFDPGEGCQRQMLLAGVTATQLHHVFVSHFHGDHCLGLAGLFQRISLDEVPHTIHVWYPASGQVFLDRLRYASSYLDRAKIELHPLSGEEVEVALPDFTLLAARLDHSLESWGFAIREPARRRMRAEDLDALDVRGADVGRLVREGRIERGDRVVTVEEVSDPVAGQRFAFVLDTRPCPGALRVAEGATLLLCESTYLSTEAREAHEHFHLTAADAARLARAAGVESLVLTHFSQRYTEPAAFVEEAEVLFRPVAAAADLDRFVIR